MSVPFVRQFTVGDAGLDCRAVKRALAAWEKLPVPTGMDLDGDQFEEPAGDYLASFKHQYGLLEDPVYTNDAHTCLEPYFDAFGVTLLEQEAAALARAAFLAVADLTVAKRDLFDYSETLGERPGERDWFRVAPWPPKGDATRFSCDCSGHAIGCGAHAGLTHPIFGVQQPIFDQDGATGAILGLTKTTAAAAEPGDLVVFVGPDAPAGVHVTILRRRVAGDWQTVNMGEQGQPANTLLSHEAAVHAGPPFNAPTLVYVRLPT